MIKDEQFCRHCGAGKGHIGCLLEKLSDLPMPGPSLDAGNPVYAWGAAP